MAYYRYTRLQQYINGQPTDVYTIGERADDVDYSTYETCMGGSGNSRWVSIPQTVCYNGDLWSMEKEQISYDGGVTWVDTTNTRRVSVIEPSASQCSGADSDWRVVYGEYICNGTSKCIKEAEYVNNSPTGRTRAGSIVELLSVDCGVMYQWVDVPDEYVCVYKCGRADKYTKQKQQYSLDNGVHWEDTGETREGNFIEKNSADCGCDTSVTRWVTVSGEYVCVGTSKYTKEKEQTSTDGTNWTDTGNTRAGSLIEASSSSCASTRWVTVSGQYSCVGTDKYNLEKEQSSTDGEHWTDTGNTKTGSTLIEANSYDCGYTPPSTTRWVADTGYVCVGTDKYNKEKEQISYDSGSTWTDTGNTKAGSTLIEANSTDCGYVPPSPYSTEYLTTEALGSGNIRLNKHTDSGYESKEPITDIQYSKNNGDWTAYTYDTNISVVTGDNIRWKGTLKDGNYYRRYNSEFSATADYKAYGNPLSLLDNDSFVDEPGAIYNNAYNALFIDNSKLKDISGLALPATTLADSCYYRMFDGCYNLTTAPELPATTLADFCYSSMFDGCYNLTTAPELPATTLAVSCYLSMFYGCTRLTTAPELPATTLANNCYTWMFSGCTSLRTAPALHSTTLADSCYDRMFQNCTSLTTTPALPATTLTFGCYNEMFSGCTRLTTALVLPATTLANYCYWGMFSRCTSLTTVPADMLPATTLEYQCYGQMFRGCTSLTTAPVLPATTLAWYCYDQMFSGCTSLTTAPVLSVRTLVGYCYNKMFYDCTSLNSVTCRATNISASNCTTNWLYNVAATGTFVKASSMTNWSTGEDGIPTGWTVQNA